MLSIQQKRRKWHAWLFMSLLGLCNRFQPSSVASFVATRHTKASQIPRPFLGSSASITQQASEACSIFSDAYPTESTSMDVLSTRFQGLTELMGSEDVALDMVRKEPILLRLERGRVKDSLEALQSFEKEGEKGLALAVVKLNPRTLTVARYAYNYSKPSLPSSLLSAKMIDLLRPFGPEGQLVAIFGGFVILILVLRPLIYGVSGGQSGISVIGDFLSPATRMLPDLPAFQKVDSVFGVDIAVIQTVLLLGIPALQFGALIKSKIMPDAAARK